jgi:uncharacterized membrane protein YhhN
VPSFDEERSRVDKGALITLVVCFAACLALVAAEHGGWLRARGVCKAIASTAFVVLAWQLGAAGSGYGRWILAALVFSCAGDILLLSARDRCFLAGLVSFLLGHVAYAIAFSHWPIRAAGLLTGIGLMGVLGLSVVAWLWRHLTGFYRGAVGAYVLAIVAMGAMAVAASAASGAWMLAAGALAFAVSDVSVARDRFVAPGFDNRAWGLPLYYAAQVVLAASAVVPP